MDIETSDPPNYMKLSVSSLVYLQIIIFKVDAGDSL